MRTLTRTQLRASSQRQLAVLDRRWHRWLTGLRQRHAGSDRRAAAARLGDLFDFSLRARPNDEVSVGSALDQSGGFKLAEGQRDRRSTGGGYTPQGFVREG